MPATLSPTSPCSLTHPTETSIERSSQAERLDDGDIVEIPQGSDPKDQIPRHSPNTTKRKRLEHVLGPFSSRYTPRKEEVAIKKARELRNAPKQPPVKYWPADRTREKVDSWAQTQHIFNASTSSMRVFLRGVTGNYTPSPPRPASKQHWARIVCTSALRHKKGKGFLKSTSLQDLPLKSIPKLNLVPEYMASLVSKKPHLLEDIKRGRQQRLRA